MWLSFASSCPFDQYCVLPTSPQSSLWTACSEQLKFPGSKQQKLTLADVSDRKEPTRGSGERLVHSKPLRGGGGGGGVQDSGSGSAAAAVALPPRMCLSKPVLGGRTDGLAVARHRRERATPGKRRIAPHHKVTRYDCKQIHPNTSPFSETQKIGKMEGWEPTAFY